MTSENLTAVTSILILIGQWTNTYISGLRAQRTIDRLADAKAAAELAAKHVLEIKEETAEAVKTAAEDTALQVKRAAESTARKVAELKEASDVKLESIHGLVNGNLTEATERIAALTMQVKALQDKLDDRVSL